LGFIMAEILQNAFQKAIDEQGEMEDIKSQNAPTIDSVIGTGPDIIQPPKTEVEEVVSHEGTDAQEGSATEAKVPESEQRTSPYIPNAAKLNTSKSAVEDPEFTVAVAAESKSSDGTAEGSVEENKSSDATVVMSVEEKKSSDGSAEVSVEDNKSSDATVLMSVEENKSSDGSAEGSVKENKSSDATNDNDGTVPQRGVSQPPSVDQMILDLKRKIAVAAERKLSDGAGEGSAEDNKSSDATVLMPVKENKSSDGSAEGSGEETSHRMLWQ
jgi:hypothetical protein